MTNTDAQTEAPVTINPSLLCHDCNTFMDETRHGIWNCPGCGAMATVQHQATVIDDGA